MELKIFIDLPILSLMSGLRSFIQPTRLMPDIRMLRHLFSKLVKSAK